MQGLIEFVKTLGPTRLVATAAVTAALIGFFALLIMRVTAPMMVPLFTELTIEDSSAIIKDLERQAIPYEIRSDGAAIMVPKDRVARLRMTFAEGGLPKGGGVGYEISTSPIRWARPRSSRTSTACARSKASWRAPSARSTASRSRVSIW